MTAGTLGFAYDGVGNRVIFTNNPGPGVVTDSYAYPTTSNRLSTVTLGAGGSRVFTYDAMGNVTNEARTGGAYSYTYDNAGRMAKFSIGGVLQAACKYDFAGRQVIRALTSPTAVTIQSVFDSDGNRIAEYNEATGALIREYVWANGEPLAVIEGGVINYIRVDHIGRPVFPTNSAGTKTCTASYLPFGEVHTQSGTAIALRFPGQWFQSESGLHQNWMRDYDPTTGRYLEADPLGLVDGASIYGYVGHNPGRWSDRQGMFSGKDVFVIPGAVTEGAVSNGIRGLLGALRLGPIGFGIYLGLGIGPTANDSIPQSLINAATVEEFCPKCNATDTREEAMREAFDWAGISTTSNRIPNDQFTPPDASFKKPRVWTDFASRNPNWTYGYWDGRSQVKEHPFGHPELTGGLNHDCPHFHARNAAGIEAEFPYRPGS